MRNWSGPKILPSEITPKTVYLNRRQWMTGAATLLASATLPQSGHAATNQEPLKAMPNAAFKPSDPATDKKLATTYNNYYEFGTGKSDPARNVDKFAIRPWTIEISGEVLKPKTLGIEDLLAMELEERIYRMRCVEAWSMVIPWLGMPLNKIAALVEPTAKAKYVRFTSAARPEEMPGIRSPVLDWPYQEGLWIDEAMHPLTLLTLGMYGETLPKQNGAPVRIVVPWKYGFKSAKSIVKIEFIETRPATAWNRAGPGEYGFYSNVNPEVDHPRWSQRKERLLPAFFADRATEKFNGYTDVASLYAGMDLKADY